MLQIPGIHHVTAIASDPQANVDFYCGALGLRLVKQTVNFDAPGTYHLYYGDHQGKPGSILTFFVWPGVGRGTSRGQRRAGQCVATSFRVGADALAHWQTRLTSLNIPFTGPFERFGEKMIAFADPDDMLLEIVACGESDVKIKGFHGVTLSEAAYETTAALLVDSFRYRLVGNEGSRFRYEAEAGPLGRVVDILCQPDSRGDHLGAGSVHHVAFRAESKEVQQQWRTNLLHLQENVTPVLDRQYFESIYFREPGGVLFEIATDPPGFAVDEPVEHLGRSLKLPPWLESDRKRIESILPALRVPETNDAN